MDECETECVDECETECVGVVVGAAAALTKFVVVHQSVLVNMVKSFRVTVDLITGMRGVCRLTVIQCHEVEEMVRTMSRVEGGHVPVGVSVMKSVFVMTTRLGISIAPATCGASSPAGWEDKVFGTVMFSVVAV